MRFTSPIYSPAWSSDGRFVYFTAKRNHTSDVFRFSVASRSVKRLTKGFNATLAYPSPDGAIVAFNSPKRKNGTMASIRSPNSIWAVAPNGSDIHLLRQAPRGATDFVFRDWAPSGKQFVGEIAYPDWEGNKIFLGNTDGNITVLKNLPAVSNPPIWSPDESKLFYIAATARPALEDIIQVPYVVELESRVGRSALTTALLDSETVFSAADWSRGGDSVVLQSDFGQQERRCQDDGYSVPCRNLVVQVLNLVTQQMEPKSAGPEDFSPLWLNSDSLVYWASVTETNRPIMQLRYLPLDGEEQTLLEWTGSLPERQAVLRGQP